MRAIAESVLHEIAALLRWKQHLLIAIEGRSAAGKTTLAAYVQEACGCNVLHMDHFFLRPEQRTAQRLSEPGGNVDHERFTSEVLIPLKSAQTFSYSPYDCHKLELAQPIQIEPRPVNIIEGTYSCHPSLFPYYDLSIFLNIDTSEQLRRIKHREGGSEASVFEDKWIPLEERYFSTFLIKEQCNLCFDKGRKIKAY